MLAMHPIHLSNDKANRSLTELEHFLSDLSMINLNELQDILTPEPLRVSFFENKNVCHCPGLSLNWVRIMIARGRKISNSFTT